MTTESTPHPRQQAIYEENKRDEVRASIPADARRVLDVGCARGGFGPTLRTVLGPDAYVMGVEAVAESAEIAATGHGFDEVLTGYFPDVLSGRDEPFDAIFFNDVLEHIVDPWSLLRELKPYLSETGVVVAAIPNIQRLDVIVNLFRGKWDYMRDGIMDRTHVRFFTRKTILDMFEEADYDVLECRGANASALWGLSDPVRWRRAAKTFAGRRSGDRQFVHYVVTARPRGQSGSSTQ